MREIYLEAVVKWAEKLGGEEVNGIIPTKF